MTDDTETVTLSKPLKTHSGEVTSLTLKEPEAGLYFDHGEGVKVRVNDGMLDFQFDNSIFKKFLAAMTGVDDILLSKLSAHDYLGRGLIKSTIPELRRDKQKRGSFAPTCRSGLRCGGSPSAG